MSKASDALAERLRIYNPHDASRFAAERGGVGVYVTYRPEGRGRVWVTAAWQVIRPGFKTDPKAHWMDHGNKTFDVRRREDRAMMLEEVLRWASQRYGVSEWAKIPGLPGSHFPVQDAGIVRAALRIGNGDDA